jgi:hypothetical protein
MIDSPRAARDPGRAVAVDDGPTTRVLRNLVEICTQAPAEVPRHRDTASALAAQLGGDAGFAWHVCELRAALGDVALAPGADDGVRSEWPRERYGELLDRHRARPDRVAVLRALGETLRQLEQAGVLPSTIVVRSRRAADTVGRPRARRATR